MKWIIILTLALIILTGCSKPIECKNITLNNTIETIKYINNTIIKEVNITCSQTSREMELIRRLKFLENQQDKIINETECMYNITEEKLQNCKNKIDMYERDIDELEDDLDYCGEGLCEYNSSWC